MKTLRDVLDYLVKHDAPSDLMRAVEDAAAIEGARPDLVAYSNSYGGDNPKSVRVVDAVLENVQVSGDDAEVDDGTSYCDNCDAPWPDEDLDDVSDFWERIEPGCIMPSGQCPDCGALCYLAKGGT